MQIFLVIAKRGLAVDMIYVATGRLGDGVAGGGIPLHRRGETGIDIGRAFRYQTNLQAAAATDQRNGLSLLAEIIDESGGLLRLVRPGRHYHDSLMRQRYRQMYRPLLHLVHRGLATAIDSRKLISTHRGGGEIQLLPDGHINDAQHGHTLS